MNELKEELLLARNIKDDELRQKEITRIINEMKKIINIDIKEKDEVLEIIQKIRNKYGDYKLGYTASDFLEGGCYYFSYMLKEIYKEKASIYVSYTDGIHSIVKIGDKFYDVEGVFGDKERIKEYYKVNNDEFNYFMDICYIDRNKEKIKSFEARCDSILEEIKNEMDKNQEKAPKI